MAQPTPYERLYNLASEQSGNTLQPVSGAHLDDEFNAVMLTLDQVLTNLALIQRDDGEIANGAVGVAALSADVLALLSSGGAVEGTWVTATTYEVNDIVEESGIVYFCLVEHVSGTFATDLAAERWVALTSSTPADGSITATKLAALAVETAKIAADAVTFAKMQNITSDRLLGRDTASSGDIEELTVGGGLEFSGSGGIQRSALTGDVTATAGSGATTIAADAVTYAKMQDVSATQRMLGRNSALAGIVEEVTLTQALDWISASVARGDVLYRGASGWARLPAGTLGQFLQTQGAGADPVWAASGLVAATVAKAWVYSDNNGNIQAQYNVASVTAHGSGHYSINFTSALPSSNYLVVGIGEAVDGSENTDVAFRQGDSKSTTVCQIRIKRGDVGTNCFFMVAFFGTT